ncbi:MAG: outer membrane protein assembly factor BamE [Hyphomicrobiaceae bacterium]
MLAAAILAASLAAGCGATITKHGNHLRETDVQQVQPGMGEDQVRMALGSPATTSQTQNGTAYYYISSTTKQQAFFAPTEVDRTVLAVYFSPLGTVERVGNYGLRDGKVFDYLSKTTPAAHERDETIFAMLFRNIGRRGLSGGDGGS